MLGWRGSWGNSIHFMMSKQNGGSSGVRANLSTENEGGQSAKPTTTLIWSEHRSGIDSCRNTQWGGLGRKLRWITDIIANSGIIGQWWNPPTLQNRFQKTKNDCGWEPIFMGKMGRGCRQFWMDKPYWRWSIAFILMEWGRACWRNRNRTLYRERKDIHTMANLKLTAEARVWMDIHLE